MKISDTIKIVIDEGKITDYLLNVNNVDGKAKAEFFLANGITIKEPKVLETLLIEQARTTDYLKTQESFFGIKYILKQNCCSLTAKDIISEVFG